MTRKVLGRGMNPDKQAELERILTKLAEEARIAYVRWEKGQINDGEKVEYELVQAARNSISALLAPTVGVDKPDLKQKLYDYILLSYRYANKLTPRKLKNPVDAVVENSIKRDVELIQSMFQHTAPPQDSNGDPHRKDL